MILVAGDRDPLVDLVLLHQLAPRFPLVSVQICQARDTTCLSLADYCREANISRSTRYRLSPLAVWTCPPPILLSGCCEDQRPQPKPVAAREPVR